MGAALEINKVVVVTNAPDTRLDLFTLPSKTRMLTTGRFECLLGLLQAHGILWETPWTTLFGLCTRAFRVTLQPFELCGGFGDGLIGRPLFGRHGTRDRLDQFVLDMEPVG
jgi:hypothetical protein